VKSDGVYQDGVKIPNAISNNKLKLTFSKGKADNPIVQGIIVYQDSLESKLFLKKILHKPNSTT